MDQWARPDGPTLMFGDIEQIESDTSDQWTTDIWTTDASDTTDTKPT